MKNLYFFCVLFFLSLAEFSFAQNNAVKSDFITSGAFLSPNTALNKTTGPEDSLQGFDEAFYKAEYLSRGLFGEEFFYAMGVQKRHFISNKYNLYKITPNTDQIASADFRPIGTGNSVQVFPCVNEDFELTPTGVYSNSNAVVGWTIESGFNTSTVNPPNINYGAACVANPIQIWNPGSPEFSIVATPILAVPHIGILPNSPFGGANVAKLQNSTTSNGLMTRLSTIVPVTLANTLFQIAYAGSWDGVHECCGSPGFRINVYTCANGSFTPIPCGDFNLSPNCPNVANGYTITNGVYWTNWNIKNIDLSAYIGQCIKISILCADCAYSGHHGCAFIDARCGTQALVGWNSAVIPNTVNYCAGSNQAVIAAPSGFSSYQWIAPGGASVSAPSGIAPTLTVSLPVPGSVYTVQVNGPACSTSFVYTLNPTQVNIANVFSGSTCIGGSSGAATVIANGSGNGYTYTWLNSNTVTVGTSSVASNLAIGVYSVIVGAIGSPGCGTAIATASVTLQPIYTETTKPFCNVNPVICPGAGSNFQWYNNLSPIPAPSGTAPCFTISSPSNGAIYRVRFTNPGGCLDSIKYTLSQLIPGTMSVLSSPSTCPGANAASLSISLNPANGAPSGASGYTVVSSGAPTPPFSVSLSPTAFNTYSTSGLSIGNYLITGFDGACSYTQNVSIQTYVHPFLILPASPTVCSGNNSLLGVDFGYVPGLNQYTYSWSPSTFLFGTNSQQVLITPTVAPGLVNTLVYTVAVTPSVVNCALTKTISVTVANPVTPSISSIPVLCLTSPVYSILTNPSGGVFSSNTGPGNPPFMTPNGVITPSLANQGLNTFTYTAGVGNCTLSSAGNFSIGGPLLSTSSDATVCPGSPVLLQAAGANNYTWSTGSNSAFIQVSPTQNTVYTVVGTNNNDPCTSSKNIGISVLPSPSLLVSGTNSICPNGIAGIQVSGANSYTWSTGSNNFSIQVSPLVTSVYTVTGTSVSNSCTTSMAHTVQVMPQPNLFVTGNGVICSGDNNILTAIGAHNYSWNTGASTASISANSFITTTYTVVGSFTNSSCSSSYTCTVVVEVCVGLEEEKTGMSPFIIYPNPSKGVFILESSTNLEISVHNALGQLVLDQKLPAGKQLLDLSEQAEGVYYLSCKTNGISRVVRLVKLD
ncbi:MAG: T9SS type A sorting domain-containing protein [Bacteroidia bacterium]|nr:T9SS type A sorting domain-containing protein [Bacteroidia bacterium]